MPQHHEATELFGDAFLLRFNLRIFELEDEATRSANQMVMMVANHLKPRLAVAKLPFHSQPCVNEEFKGAIHRGIPYFGMLFAHACEQVIDRNMLRGAKKMVDNGVTLRGGIEALLRAVFRPAMFELGQTRRSAARTGHIQGPDIGAPCRGGQANVARPHNLCSSAAHVQIATRCDGV